MDKMKIKISHALAFLCIFIICLPLALEGKKKKTKHKHKVKYQYEVSVAAIFCDEAPYLPEWIEYYKLIGVDHFYLFNNHSSDNYQKVLEPYIASGSVDLIEWPPHAANWNEWDHIQVNAYQEALRLARNRTKWLALIDTDEYIVPVSEETLPQFLKHYENNHQGGLCFMWKFFGTSHVDKIPEEKLLIETLVQHSGPAANGDISKIWNQGAYKSIIRPEYVSALGSPHYCTYVEGRNHEMVSYELAHINHYWTRDNHFFQTVKIPRRFAWGQDVESAKAWAAGMNKTSEDNPILRFVPQLRARMGLSID